MPVTPVNELGNNLPSSPVSVSDNSFILGRRKQLKENRVGPDYCSELPFLIKKARNWMKTDEPSKIKLGDDKSFGATNKKYDLNKIKENKIEKAKKEIKMHMKV